MSQAQSGPAPTDAPTAVPTAVPTDNGPGPSAKGLMSVDAAMAQILAMAAPLPAEEIALADAGGRWLASAVVASRDQPPFDASAMDGYAVVEPPHPGTRYRVIGEAAAGHGFTDVIGEGQAVRIFTGAPLPDGARHVVIQENIARDGDFITVTAAGSGTNIRARGQDFKIGDQLQPRLLRAADLALIASMNVARVSVARRPEVAIIATGDELIQPGETPRPDQIVASNSFALSAIARAEGARVRILPIARDRAADLAQVLEMARGADVIVTSGGASVGDHDLVAPVAKSLGMQAAFWKVALRPGKPLMAGRLFDAVLLGLPGNPVSSMVCAELFLRPLLRALQGDPTPAPRPHHARVAVDLPANGPRRHFMRATLQHDGTITPAPSQDSALLQVLAQSNALLIRPENAPALKAGDIAPYLPI